MRGEAVSLNACTIDIDRPNLPYDLNSGGPRSRTRTQIIDYSLLGSRQHPDDMPRLAQAALDFGDSDPLEVVLGLLATAGIDNPETLRGAFWLPQERCICRPFTCDKPLQVANAPREEVLATVLLLSLCTPSYFDPQRPVLLTRTSLTRHLELFSGRGFYA